MARRLDECDVEFASELAGDRSNERDLVERARSSASRDLTGSRKRDGIVAWADYVDSREVEDRSRASCGARIPGRAIADGKLRSDGQCAGRVYFEVGDNGPGIPIEAQSHIFEPFVRVGGTSQPGTGIGLATVKRLVTASGGHIGVRSTIGVGTCFRFDLPRAPSPMTSLENDASSHHRLKLVEVR
jgi:signal transduction histidine kinase